MYPVQPGEVYRIYRPEWQTVYTSQAKGAEGLEECMAHFGEHYAGRVRPDDMRYDPAGPGDEYWLRLRLPCLKGEWRDKDVAERHAASLGPDVVLVPRFSAEERKLTGYGQRRLHGGQ